MEQPGLHSPSMWDPVLQTVYLPAPQVNPLISGFMPYSIERNFVFIYLIYMDEA